MFGTLHWNSHTKEVKFVERPDGSSNAEKSSACDRCRARKLKCSTKDDSCSRCKRLGKTCTFSSMKNRGDQSILQTGTTSVQQETSLDLLTQSSASPNSKDAENEEGQGLDTQPLASSLPAEGSIDDSEHGQQSLAESPTERLTDFPSNFEIALLAEFSQQTDDQGGDGFDFTLSPSPFISTEVLPSTHHDPTRSEDPRTSEGHRPSSLGPRDEMSWYFPPCRQLQDMPLLEIGSDATSTSFHASTLASTDFSFQNLSGESCQCLAAVVFALEKFEAGCNADNRAELDSVVACQKEAIKCCRSMLVCRSCMAKRETLVLLVFMIEKIAVACGRVVVLYRTKDGNDRAGLVPHSSDWQELLLGDYEISSPLEWDNLVRVLIHLQLRAMIELLADMRNVGSRVLGETQMIKLGQAETRVGDLEKDMQNV